MSVLVTYGTFKLGTSVKRSGLLLNRFWCRSLRFRLHLRYRDSHRRLHFPEMDWQGQKLAEQLMQILLLISVVVAFVVGYTTASFRTMMLIYAGGVVLTSLITVPNWPFFNRHPLKWLDPSEAEKHPKPQAVTVSSKKKSSKK